MGSDVKVAIRKDLYEKIEKRVEATEFNSVSEYVNYVLEEVLEQITDDEKDVYSKEDEEKVKEKLRSLGYLD